MRVLIEFPSEEEGILVRKSKWSEASTLGVAEDKRSYNDGFADCYQWLKSKIIK